ncbi:MAG: phosphatidylglycerol lysyltransferase domain-containing protein [Ferruginibacter sp.]
MGSSLRTALCINPVKFPASGIQYTASINNEPQTMKYKPSVIIKRLHLKELLAILFILAGIYFFRQERHELTSIIPSLEKANWHWILAGVLLTVVYILLQTGMYVYSFASVRAKLHWLKALELFLKRNFLSVFLPAGGITALAYMPDSLRRSVIHKKEVHQSSGIYAFTGILSLFLVGLPVIVYTFTQSQHNNNAAIGIICLALLLSLLLFIFYSVRKRGWVYKLSVKLLPSTENKLSEIVSFNWSFFHFTIAILFSICIELSGMLHLFIAMLAVGVHPSFEAACIGYVVSVILLATSPFLRGLGAIELSLTYILTRYGYSAAQALEITILYRIFEFWLPLSAGLVAFAAKGKQIFLRLAPALLIFVLGIINILSAITPPIASRIRLLRQYIPTNIIHASNLLVLMMGLLLLVTATFLVRGLRNAWLIALIFSLLSFVTHLTKALDWEESSVSFFAIIILLTTYKQYRLKSNPRLINIGVITAVSLFFAVVIFETIGFYYLDTSHFGIDFTWKESIGFSIKSFLLLTNAELRPVTRFGREFIALVNVLSTSSWIFFFYTIIRPFIKKTGTNPNALPEAKSLLNQFGCTAVDYFKVNDDKSLFFADDREGFIAYRVANGFAIVLDEPVCAEHNKIPMLKAFDNQCRRMGLKTAFYRVDEESIYYFEQLRKKKLLIGQEAVMEIHKFSLDGRDKKSLRNTLNSLARKGYATCTCKAPLSDQLIIELKSVSDEWLAAFNKKETIFSQGMFNEKLICEQDVIVMRDPVNKAVAFLNIIPDYTPAGYTYDMIRKTADAPGGCMDALIIKAIQYGKEQGMQWLNLGLVPMSGITEPDNTAERVVKFAYEKIKRFQHYQGLRDFKEKYATGWLNKYLVYENDFDLIQLPAALNKVMQPQHKN